MGGLRRVRLIDTISARVTDGRVSHSHEYEDYETSRHLVYASSSGCISAGDAI